MTNPAIPHELIKAVREHARRHYEDGGWDFVVECWEDGDVLRAIGGATTVNRAIRNVAKVVATMDSRRRDIEGEAF